jgi:hypothetical protein
VSMSQARSPQSPQSPSRCDCWQNSTLLSVHAASTVQSHTLVMRTFAPTGLLARSRTTQSLFEVHHSGKAGTRPNFAATA